MLKMLQNFQTLVQLSLKNLKPKNQKSPPKVKENQMTVNWNDPNSKISKYFTVKEAIYLPSWDRMATEADGLNEEIKQNLIVLFIKLDSIREYFGKPIIVHCAYRPKEYNTLVKGAKQSAHLFGKGVDFHIHSINCDAARVVILDKKFLEILELRMEDLPQSAWIHLGTDWKPGMNHFFKP